MDASVEHEIRVRIADAPIVPSQVAPLPSVLGCVPREESDGVLRHKLEHGPCEVDLIPAGKSSSS